MPPDHRAFVESWLARRVRGGDVRVLADEALGAVWSRARRGLAGLTLQALGRAARDAAARELPLLSDVTVGPEGFSLEGIPPAPPDELRAALGGLLIELLSVVESTTGDILAPALQAELLRIGRAGAEG